MTCRRQHRDTDAPGVVLARCPGSVVTVAVSQQEPS